MLLSTVLCSSVAGAQDVPRTPKPPPEKAAPAKRAPAKTPPKKAAPAKTPPKKVAPAKRAPAETPPKKAAPAETPPAPPQTPEAIEREAADPSTHVRPPIHDDAPPVEDPGELKSPFQKRRRPATMDPEPPRPINPFEDPPATPPRAIPRGGRARLGVMVLPLDAQDRRTLDVEGERGLRVTQVLEDSLAHREGMLPGDIILGVNGAPMTSSADVLTALRGVPSGSRIAVEVLRAGRVFTLPMTLDFDDGQDRPRPRLEPAVRGMGPSRLDSRLDRAQRRAHRRFEQRQRRMRRAIEQRRRVRRQLRLRELQLQSR